MGIKYAMSGITLPVETPVATTPAVVNAHAAYTSASVMALPPKFYY